MSAVVHGEITVGDGYSWVRRTDGKYRVIPFSDFALIWPSATCVVDDFGTLVRVGFE